MNLRCGIGAAVLAALSLAAASAAWAGDGAAVEPLGFSADGRYFAFEQYGTESVSGMDYSRTDVVEVATGKSVDGLPLVVDMTTIDDSLLQDPNQDPLVVVRQQAQQQAAPLLQRYGINGSGTRIGNVAASRPRETTLAIADETDGRQSSVVTALQQAAVTTMPLDLSAFGTGAHIELHEQVVSVPAATCADYGYTAKGFTLALQRAGKPPLMLIQAQQTGDGCPLGFGLAEAHALPLPDGSTALAVLVQRFEYVMEGPDRRFSIVTGLVK